MERSFGRDKSLIVKGIAVFFMFIHHLFLSSEYWLGNDIYMPVLGIERMMKIASFSKVCVALFLFVTAYGMTLKFRDAAKETKDLVSITLVKYISLQMMYLFVFFLTQVIWLLFGNAENLRFYGVGLEGAASFILDALGISYFFSDVVINVTWWYMPVVFSTLLLLPLLWKAYEVLGILMLPAALLLPSMLGIRGSFAFEYLPVIVVGMLAADGNWVAKIADIGGKRLVFRILKLGAEIYLLRVCFVVRNNTDYDCLVDALFAILIAVMVCEYVSKIPLVNKLFALYGKHSLNIFLLHSLFILYFGNDKLFALNNGMLILIVLAILSMGLSLITEGLKKVCCVEKIIKFLTGLIKND